MSKLQATTHDYQGAVSGNGYDSNANGTYPSWQTFKEAWGGFNATEAPFADYDDTYNHLFRFDVSETEGVGFSLELCFLLPRKGIYAHIVVEDLSQTDWDEIRIWLKGRRAYQQTLWAEVEEEGEN